MTVRLQNNIFILENTRAKHVSCAKRTQNLKYPITGLGKLDFFCNCIYVDNVDENLSSKKKKKTARYSVTEIF